MDVADPPSAQGAHIKPVANLTDSIAAGKRLPEREYEVVKNKSVAKITDMFSMASGSGSGSSKKKTS